MATKHDKTELVGPALTEVLGLRVVEVDVDTDLLGTFSGEVPRVGSPLDTAVAKARMGMAAAGLAIGVASEGTVGPSAANPFLTVARELLVLVDDERHIVIADTEIGYDLITIGLDATADQDLTRHLERGQFPAHAVLVRPADGCRTPVFKAIRDLQALRQAMEACCGASADRRARVETDLRAHLCPSRRTIIARAARRLALRVATPCPECASPGFGLVRFEIGVPCQWCGHDTETVRAHVLGCVACRAERVEQMNAGPADPSHCAWCNP
jgi:hypothetical protein